eukprot:4772533-Lingulodinium_polyedra.AAC.1
MNWWVAELGARLHLLAAQPGRATCNTGRALDYFVAPEHMRGAFTDEVVYDDERLATHSAVAVE